MDIPGKELARKSRPLRKENAPSFGAPARIGRTTGRRTKEGFKMIRNLKILGLALVAMLAFGAMVASAASASFHAEQKEVQLTVTPGSLQTQKFQYVSGGITVECNSLTVESTFVGTEHDEGPPTAWTGTDITAIPHYGNCEPILGNAVTVDTNSCYYTFTLAAGSTSGTAHIKCNTANDGFTITIGSLCTIKVGPQEVGPISYSNVGSGTTREVTIHPTVTGIQGSRTGSILCGAASSTSGTYKGDLTVTGEKPGTETHVGVWVS